MDCDRDNLIKILSTLIQIPSLSGEEERIASHVSDILKTLGYNPRVDKYYNVYAEIGTGRTLLLNSHLDTVPPGKGWTVDPYAGKVSDGKIYGVGSSDNKSGVSAMIEIARILSQKTIDGKVIFLFTSREESNKQESRKALIGKVKADAAICLDHDIPVERKVVETLIGCKGIANFKLRIYGKAYHSSEPAKGVNAIYRACRFINTIQKAKFPAMKKPVKEKAVASVTKINTDGWATKIPDECEVTINYRALPRETPEKIELQIAKIAEKSLRANFNLKPAIIDRGYLISLNEEIVKAAEKAAEELGFKWKFSIAKGWLDAAFFTNILNIPTVCIGPSTKGQAHVKDEFENIENLIYGAEAVLKTVLNYISQ